MENWTGKVAIVTGASSGIGAATVEALVRSGVKVVGLARRVEKIRDLADKLKGQKGKLYPIQCDVQKEEDILKAFAWAEDELGGVDILVNNAGVISFEPIIASSTEAYRKILDVNVLAFAICSREAVKSMTKRGGVGHIIVVNSVLGHNAEGVTRGINLYPASKFALTGMTASLRIELAKVEAKIKVTSVSPGLVDTEMTEAFTRDFHDNYSLKSKDLADAIIYVLSTPSNVQVKELTIETLKKVIDVE